MWQGQGSGVKGQVHNQGKGARSGSGSGSGTGAWGRAILRDRVQSQSKWQGQVQGEGSDAWVGAEAGVRTKQSGP